MTKKNELKVKSGGGGFYTVGDFQMEAISIDVRLMGGSLSQKIG
jgi:hypothetical protein